jgi:hypothetical protein
MTHPSRGVDICCVVLFCHVDSILLESILEMRPRLYTYFILIGCRCRPALGQNRNQTSQSSSNVSLGSFLLLLHVFPAGAVVPTRGRATRFCPAVLLPAPKHGSDRVVGYRPHTKCCSTSRALLRCALLLRPIRSPFR